MAKEKSSPDEYKEQNNKYILSKFEYDLYHEEDDIAEPVIRVKRTTLPNKGERWRIFTDNKVTFTIEGSKISKKEREFLQSIDGFNFLLSLAKIGINSMNHFKTELKQTLKNKES